MKTKLSVAPFEPLEEKRLVIACEKLARGDADLAFIFKTYGAPPLWKRVFGILPVN